MVAEVTLRQLLDMSLGNPEIGVVNFNYLYSMLHIIIIRLEKLLEASFDAGILNDITLKDTIRLETTAQEFSKRVNFKKSSDSFVKSSNEVDFLIECKTKEEKKKLPPSGKLVSKKALKSTSKKESVTAVDEDSRGSLGKNVIMSKQSWITMQKKMKLLEDQVDTLLKTDSEDILGHIQKFSPDMSTSQYIEMAHRLSQSKRMDVNEELIRQLSVMVEETNSSVAELKNQGGVAEVKSLVQKVKDIETKEIVLEESLESLEKIIGVPVKKRKISSEDSTEFDDDEEDDGEFELKQNIPVCYKPKKTIKEMIDAKMDKETYSNITGVSPAVLVQIEEIEHGAKFIEKYRLQYELQDKIILDLMNKLDDDGYDLSDILQRKKSMEDDLMEKLKDKNLLNDADDNTTPNSILNEKLLEMEANLQELNRKVETVSSRVQNSSCDDNDVRKSIAELQEKAKTFSDEITQVITDGLDNQKKFQDMINNIGYLKKFKADVDDVIRLKEEKVDKSVINNNVLELAFNKFQNEITALNNKVSHLDESHQTSLNLVNDSIQNKLDKTEIAPFKEFVSSKLKMMVVKIKKLAKRSGADNEVVTRKQLLKKRHRVPYDKPKEPITEAYSVPQSSIPLMPIKQSISLHPSFMTPNQHPQQKIQEPQMQPQPQPQQEQQQQQPKKLVVNPKCSLPSTMSDLVRSKRSQQDGGTLILTNNTYKHGVGKEMIERTDDSDNDYCNSGNYALPFSYQKMHKSGGASFDDTSTDRQEPDGCLVYKGPTICTSPTPNTTVKSTFHLTRKFTPDIVTSNQQPTSGGGGFGKTIHIGGGAVDAPLSSVPFSSSQSTSSDENIRRVKGEKSPPPPRSLSPEKDEKSSSRITVSPNPFLKRSGTSRKPLSACGSPRATARQSPPPLPLGSASARSSSVGSMGAMQAKFTSTYAQPSRPTSGLVIKTTSSTGLQVRGSQKVVTSSPLSRTSSSGNISQLGRARSSSKTREQDT